MPRELARQWDRNNQIDRSVLTKLADLGLFGITIPERYGGSGRDITATMIVIEELCRRSTAIGSAYIYGACYAGMNLVESADESQRQEWLPLVARGEMLFSYGLTEPDVGSDLAGVTTTAVRDGEVVRINGAKRFCSGTTFTDYIYTLVNSDPDGERYRNLSFVLIPPRSPGVTIEPQHAMGLKGSMTTDVTFTDVEVPATNIVGGDQGWNQGWAKLAGPGLDVEKIEVAAMALGIATGAVEDAWAYAQERVQFGRPVSSHQSIRHMLSEGRTRLLAARLMTYHAARLLDEDKPAGVETSMAKLFVCDTATEIVLSMQRVMGAYGYVEDFDMERYVRDVLAMPIIGGSSAIQRNNIANRLGLTKE